MLPYGVLHWKCFVRSQTKSGIIRHFPTHFISDTPMDPWVICLTKLHGSTADMSQVFLPSHRQRTRTCGRLCSGTLKVNCVEQLVVSSNLQAGTFHKSQVDKSF